MNEFVASRAVFTQGLRTVILGDPGIGKSTLAAKLAFDLASDRLLQAEGYVPFLVVVRDHTARDSENAETFLHYLEKTSRTYNLVPPPGGIEYLLANRKPFVIVDGLDELGESAFRAKFTDLLNSFASLFPWVRIVVTSRSVGYEEASLDGDLFDHYAIAPFDDNQVARYVSAWFKLMWLDSYLGHRR
ncbi:MAG TPA: NACHT domain-containing protein [Jatrophihabitans sp.]|uniref:NACHT domain-containing protein n=1 Tax=Jatrophihabitans sp. TaxID=1932789 RepID=UPI002EFB640D